MADFPINALPKAVASLSQEELDQILLDPTGRTALTRSISMLNQRPDTAPLQDYARGRQDSSQMGMLNALAAQYAGEDFSPIQKHFLDRSASDAEAQKFGDYGYVSGGKFVENPFQANEQIAGKLFDVGKQIATDYRSEKSLESAERRAAARDDAMERRLNATLERGQKKRSVGYSPDGTQIFVDQYGNNTTGDDKPYEGDIIPPSDWNKGVGSAKENIQSVTQIDNILGEVSSDPDTFSRASATLSRVPTTFGMQSAAMSALLTPNQLEKRANILKLAAMEVNKLYGAALSAGESTRASGFIPDAEDTVETILPKLKAAREWAATSQRLYTPGQIKAAKGRMSSQRKIVRRGRKADGTPVVMYDDGSIE